MDTVKTLFMEFEEKLNLQLNQVKAGNPLLNLAKPCKVGDGINQLDLNQISYYESIFQHVLDQKDITFFIPASGSGSRMFGSLFEFVNNDIETKTETIKFIEQFLNNIENFAFYNSLTKAIKAELKHGEINIEKLISYILSKDGLNFGQLPKGLIPFHLYGKFMINPFQEQILQGTDLAGDTANFHFTINRLFEPQIKKTINTLKEISGINFSYTFSEQSIESNSIAFDSNFKPIKDGNKNQITRPSGHGALLENLNQIDADLIFIKNIDNVQHSSKSNTGLKTKRVLAGFLLEFQRESFKLLKLLDNNNNDWFNLAKTMNKSFNLCISEENISNSDFIHQYFNRPIRVCGMVKNEGQAGGGPFWVEDRHGEITPQIIEKSQINKNQLSILLHATHFNPVDIVCGVKNYKDIKFDLNNFVNDELYFVVNKTQKGTPIKYIEKPGLWNGSMYNWMTIFVEIDSDCFSPVKTVLDLLKTAHKEN